MNIGIVGNGIVGGAIKYGFEKLGHNIVVHDIKLKTKIEDVVNTNIVFICVGICIATVCLSLSDLLSCPCLMFSYTSLPSCAICIATMCLSVVP